MCQLPPPPQGQECHKTSLAAPKPAFSCARLNSTTFVLKENDKWGERPLIYAKSYSNHVVLVDSGCGGSSQTSDLDMTLKRYLELVPVVDNGDKPINPDGAKSYIIICTHCHYDHIGGLSELDAVPGVTIWASSLGEEFIMDPEKMSTASMCRFVGMEVPKYTVTSWATDGAQVMAPESVEDLGLIVYHTPGHMPDQLAIWDPRERYLFVGDTVYEHAPILFPERGSIFQYRYTISKLRSLVQAWNADARTSSDRVKIACGHNTLDADADLLLAKTDEFLLRVLAYKVSAVDLPDSPWFGGQPAVEFKDKSGGVYFQGLRKSFEHLR